jgi:hypothetical protein
VAAASTTAIEILLEEVAEDQAVVSVEKPVVQLVVRRSHLVGMVGQFYAHLNFSIGHLELAALNLNDH